MNEDNFANIIIDKIFLCSDKEYNKNNFIFFSNDNDFYEMYLDEKVLFINSIILESSFETYLEDLEQVIELEINFNPKVNTVIKYFADKHYINIENAESNIKIYTKNNETFLLPITSF